MELVKIPVKHVVLGFSKSYPKANRSYNDPNIISSLNIEDFRGIILPLPCFLALLLFSRYLGSF